ncbi:MAG: hypothetical protein GY899_12955, partial [Verrucomicrobiaceae bacterium]|nr:hypothetical protein [Verrucomicrobiaceae bacterium]
MFKSKTLFSIDNVNDVTTLKMFLKYCDNAAVLGHIKPIQMCTGMWQGILEPSFLMDEDDFDKRVRGTPFVMNQEAFLHVPGDPRQPCDMENNQTGEFELVGRMVEVSHAEAMQSEGWTHRDGKY